jgi:hypothetical protein
MYVLSIGMLSSLELKGVEALYFGSGDSSIFS